MRVLKCIVTCAMLAGATLLPAQQIKPLQERSARAADQIMTRMVVLSQACPIGFRAEIDPRLTLRDVKNSKRMEESTFVRLHFTTADVSKTIVTASVTAHGVSPHGELMLVGQKTDDNRTQAFELTPANPTAGLLQTELHVTAVPFVRWIELNQVTYDDGTVWHAAEGAVCKAGLSNYHPV